MCKCMTLLATKFVHRYSNPGKFTVWNVTNSIYHVYSTCDFREDCVTQNAKMFGSRR